MKSTLILLSVVLAGLAPSPSAADLKSFFHGDAFPPKAPPPAAVATVATAPGATSDPQVEDFLRAFAAAVMARDAAPLQSRLAEKFSMPGLPEGHTAPEIFTLGVETMPGPTALVVRSVETKGSVRTARVELHLPNRITLKVLQFDPAGRLVASDLFAARRVHEGDDPAAPQR